MAVSLEEKKASELMQELSLVIAEEVPNMGFMLVIFNNTAGGQVNYASNCERQDVRNAMNELFKKWDEGMPDIPAHLKYVRDD